MSENNLWAGFWLCLTTFLAVLTCKATQCEMTTPASITACKTACGSTGVHSANRMECECK